MESDQRTSKPHTTRHVLFCSALSGVAAGIYVGMLRYAGTSFRGAACMQARTHIQTDGIAANSNARAARMDGAIASTVQFILPYLPNQSRDLKTRDISFILDNSDARPAINAAVLNLQSGMEAVDCKPGSSTRGWRDEARCAEDTIHGSDLT